MPRSTKGVGDARMANTLTAPVDADFLSNMAGIDALLAYAAGEDLNHEALARLPLSPAERAALGTTEGKVAVARWSRLYSESLDALNLLRRHYVAGAPLTKRDLSRMDENSRKLVQTLGETL